MDNNGVIVKWIGEDVQGLHPEWSEYQCEWALDEVARHLINAVTEFGNEVLENLLNTEIEITDCPEED